MTHVGLRHETIEIFYILTKSESHWDEGTERSHLSDYLNGEVSAYKIRLIPQKRKPVYMQTGGPGDFIQKAGDFPGMWTRTGCLGALVDVPGRIYYLVLLICTVPNNVACKTSFTGNIQLFWKAHIMNNMNGAEHRLNCFTE